MTTLVVDDQLLLCNITSCILSALAQRAHQLVVHGEERAMGKHWRGGSRGLFGNPKTYPPGLFRILARDPEVPRALQTVLFTRATTSPPLQLSICRLLWNRDTDERRGERDCNVCALLASGYKLTVPRDQETARGRHFRSKSRQEKERLSYLMCIFCERAKASLDDPLAGLDGGGGWGGDASGSGRSNGGRTNASISKRWEATLRQKREAELCEELKRKARLPVTVITGFLGSGKTTFVNHLLSARHGRKLAVIENEFGEVAIDDALLGDGGVERGEEAQQVCEAP